VKKLRKILWPFSVPYDGVTRLRNYFFNTKIFDSQEYDFPVIGIGNLSVGGTGKSPMTEYVLNLLKDTHKLATLSRGYGRVTKGYYDVTPDSLASEVGDEPLQFARKFKAVQVAVCESRVEGVLNLRSKSIKPEVIVLDDVFQHRKVKPGLLIMLTAYNDLFYKDLILPAGNLRESRAGADRADIIVVTKCPEELSLDQQQQIKHRIKAYSEAPVFFAAIAYDSLRRESGVVSFNTLLEKEVAVVTGIAKPKPFLDYLNQKEVKYTHIEFGDHHNFTDAELADLDQQNIIITTEKDYVRLRGKLKKAALYYIPISFKLLYEQADFDEKIKDFVKSKEV